MPVATFKMLSPLGSSKRRTLTNDYRPRNVALVVVWKQNQFRNEDAVVEPDCKHHAGAQPAHGVHHEVQSKLHGCWTSRWGGGTRGGGRLQHTQTPTQCFMVSDLQITRQEWPDWTSPCSHAHISWSTWHTCYTVIVELVLKSTFTELCNTWVFRVRRCRWLTHSEMTVSRYRYYFIIPSDEIKYRPI